MHHFTFIKESCERWTKTIGLKNDGGVLQNLVPFIVISHLFKQDLLTTKIVSDRSDLASFVVAAFIVIRVPPKNKKRRKRKKKKRYTLKYISISMSSFSIVFL